jgi:hypothetical protein
LHVREPPPPVEAIVIAPEPLVTEIPVPAVIVALVNVLPVVFPIRSWPSVYEPCPVPPSATAKSVIPVILPPVIVTALEACVAIEPRPSDVLAVAPDSATQLVPSPTIILPSVTANPQ